MLVKVKSHIDFNDVRSVLLDVLVLLEVEEQSYLSLIVVNQACHRWRCCLVIFRILVIDDITLNQLLELLLAILFAVLVSG